MAVYLSPGVYLNELDLSVLPTSSGPLRPAFIGTAKKGPLNQAILITTSTQAIDTFGEPFPESYLMYAVLTHMEENGQCYVMRVGVECKLGQADVLDDICVDTSGARNQGWGRIPLFTGIDYGRISLRFIDADSPISFQEASVSTPEYNDVNLSQTDGPTSATLTVTGTYTGIKSDSYVLIITGAPTGTDPVDGATYQIVRNSDGTVVSEGDLTGATPFSIGDGLSVAVEVSSGRLDVNDTFLFDVIPNNRKFTVVVEGNTSPVEYTMPVATYSDVASFVTAFNTVVGTGQGYLMVQYVQVDGTTIPQLRTTLEGRRIQLGSKDADGVVDDTAAFALTVGKQIFEWDIPRSYLLGLDAGPYTITTSNNRVSLDVIGGTATKNIIFNIPVGIGQTAASIASSIHAAGVTAGQRYFESYALTLTDGTEHVIISTPIPQGNIDHSLDTLYLQSTYSNLKTLRFAEELEISFPYKRSYRGYSDNRLTLPSSGESDAATPLSCENNPTGSDQCTSDLSYYENIVGWLVATSAGTWLDGYTATLEVATGVVGDASGRYNVLIRDENAQVVSRVEDVSFDANADRYLSNTVNPGTIHGGRSGNAYFNYEPRPAFLNNDPNSTDDANPYVVRQPSTFQNKEFGGTANGIPLDPAYSSALDAAVIGSPELGTGIFAFENPQTIDINILAIPGFSSGAVIGQGLQMCERRGDVLFLIDPPFGLRPQQVVDWHNGMLLSDLRSAINSSYGALYWGWIRTFDQFNRIEIWVPPSGHVSAVFARTARVAEQWSAPAGLRRGRLLTALELEYSPGQGESDLLYGSGNAVNPITKFPQDGIVVFGQRTLQRSQSALDRVNVRMLLIYIKKNLIPLLRNYIFEPNDKFLWRQVVAAIEPFLGDIQARRGLSGYKVVCDETNNTPERIDANQLTVTIFVKPTRTVEFVALNLVTLQTGASFSAEEVLAAGGIVSGA